MDGKAAAREMDNTPIFEAIGLTKRYKQKTALDRVDLRLDRGHIYGLVGSNGAGKTTLMRILMGLDFPTEGEIRLYGQSGRRNLERQRRRIGALIEQPIGYADMSAKRNLVLQRMLLDEPKRADIGALLKLVGLDEKTVGRGPISGYSLGMRQRYGLAAALLGDPDFLVLDEPGTGLDPEGMRDLRAFLLTRKREKGTTMLISGHILHALYEIATDFIFLSRGRVLRVMTHAQLESALGPDGDIEDYYLSISDSAGKGE